MSSLHRYLSVSVSVSLLVLFFVCCLSQHTFALPNGNLKSSSAKNITVPSGSYQKQCMNCAVDIDNILTCTCVVRLVDSDLTLNLSKCVNGKDIVLDPYDNLLLCVKNGSLPVGSYANSCSTCFEDHSNVLHCSCLVDGFNLQSSINLTNCINSVEIGNVNGQLVCVENAPLPSGPYVDSCNGCFMDNSNHVYCSCSTNYGSKRETSLNINSCPNSQNIANENGVLVCGRSSATIVADDFQPCVVVTPCGKSATAFPIPSFIMNDGSCQSVGDGVYVTVAEASCKNNNPVQFNLFGDASCNYYSYVEWYNGPLPAFNISPDCLETTRNNYENFTCGYTPEQCQLTPQLFVNEGIQIGESESAFLPSLASWAIFLIVTSGGAVLFAVLYYACWRHPVQPKVVAEERKHGNIFRHCVRAFFADPGSVRAFSNEPEEYQANRDFHRYILWRRSIWPVLAVLQAAVVLVDCLVLKFSLVPNWDKALDKTPFYLKPAVQHVNQVQLAFEIIRIIMYFTALLGILYCWKHWRDVRRTQRMISIIWAIQFTFPFVLQLFPYKSLFDYEDALIQGLNSAFGFQGSFNAKQVRWILQQLCQVSSPRLTLLPGINFTKNICPHAFDLFIVLYDAQYGLKYLGITLLQLVPIGLGILPGISEGAAAIKSMLPWHYFPPILTAFGDFVYAPLLLAFLCGIYQAVGDIIFLGLIIFMLLKQAFHLPMILKLSGSYNSDVLRAISERIGWQRRFFLVLAALYLIVYLSLRQFYWDALSDLDIPAVALMLNWWNIALIILRSLAAAFMTKLFISGYILALCIHMHKMHCQADFQSMMQALLIDLEDKDIEEIIKAGPETGNKSLIVHTSQPFSSSSSSVSAISPDTEMGLTKPFI